MIEEPLIKTNTKNCLWIRDLSWWFFKEFEVTEEMLQEDVIRLNIEMLDFKADIILNYRPVARHTNAFCPFCEDVKRFRSLNQHPGDPADLRHRRSVSEGCNLLLLRQRQCDLRPAGVSAETPVHLRLGLVPACPHLRHRPRYLSGGLQRGEDHNLPGWIPVSFRMGMRKWNSSLSWIRLI